MHKLRPRSCLSTSRPACGISLLRAYSYPQIRLISIRFEYGIVHSVSWRCRPKAFAFYSAPATFRAPFYRAPTLHDAASFASAKQRKSLAQHRPLSLEEVAKLYPTPRSHGEHVPFYFYRPDYAQAAVCQAFDMVNRRVIVVAANITPPHDGRGPNATSKVYHTSFQIDGLDRIDISSKGNTALSAERAAWAQLFLRLLADGSLEGALAEIAAKLQERNLSIKSYGQAISRVQSIIRLGGTVPELSAQTIHIEQTDKAGTFEWLVSVNTTETSLAPIYRSSSNLIDAVDLALQRHEELLQRHADSLQPNELLKAHFPNDIRRFLEFYTSYTGKTFVLEHRRSNLELSGQHQHQLTMLLDGDEIRQQIWPRKSFAEFLLRWAVALPIITSEPDMFAAFIENRGQNDVHDSSRLAPGGPEDSVTSASKSTTTNESSITSSPLPVKVRDLGHGDQLETTNHAGEPSSVTSDAMNSAPAATTPGDYKTSRAVVAEHIEPLKITLHPASMVLMQRGLIAAEKAQLLVKKVSPIPASVPSITPVPKEKPQALSALKERNRKLQESIQQFNSVSEATDFQKQRRALPAYARRKEIARMVNNHQHSVLVGGTGCGKSTQVPQLILDSEIRAGRGAQCNILCTQPRRVATISLAKRVADERGEDLGQSVGYRVRLDAVPARDHASITYLTTGLLLEQLKSSSDRCLEGVSHIIMDEVHERAVELDILMLSLKRLLTARRAASRPVPKIVLMSATLDLEQFTKYWSIDGQPCPSLTIPGELFPVKREFVEQFLPDTDNTRATFDQLRENYRAEVAEAESYLADELALDEALSANDHSTALDLPQQSPVPILVVIAAIVKICNMSQDGAILVFLPGIEEIRSAHSILSTVLSPSTSSKAHSIPEMLQLHSSLPKEEQFSIYRPLKKGYRRIILSTNIAETSVTVPHVRFVVDSGVIREAHYNQASSATTLVYTWESQSSSKQRMGRAGRLQAGHYVALFSESRYIAMQDTLPPQLLRYDLSSTALLLKRQFPEEKIATLFGEALQPPFSEGIEAARSKLQAMGAIDSDEKLTMLGSVLSRIPLHPRWARVVLTGMLFKCLEPLMIIAISTQHELFFRPYLQKAEARMRHREFNVSESDHLTTYHAYISLRQVEQEYGSAAAQAFASENFLAWGSYNSIKKEAAALAGNLPGFVHRESSDRKSPFDVEMLNSNNHKHELIKCLILNGFPANLAAWHRGNTWKVGDKTTLVHPSSFLDRRPASVDRSDSVIRLFTVLSESNGDIFSMGRLSSLTGIGGLLFCERLTTQAGRMRINGLREVKVADNPGHVAKLILEYKKLLSRIINDALQQMILEGWNSQDTASGSADFLRRTIDLIETNEVSGSSILLQPKPSEDGAAQVAGAG